MVFHSDYFVLSTPNEFRGNNREVYSTPTWTNGGERVDNADEQLTVECITAIDLMHQQHQQ